MFSSQNECNSSVFFKCQNGFFTVIFTVCQFFFPTTHLCRKTLCYAYLMRSWTYIEMRLFLYIRPNSAKIIFFYWNLLCFLVIFILLCDCRMPNILRRPYQIIWKQSCNGKSLPKMRTDPFLVLDHIYSTRKFHFERSLSMNLFVLHSLSHSRHNVFSLFALYH